MDNELTTLETELLELRSSFISTVDALELLKAKAKLKELEYLAASGHSAADGYYLEIGKSGVNVVNARDKQAKVADA